MIEGYEGRVEAWLGHRFLASFHGAHAAVDAIRAAAGVMQTLAHPGSAFEESRPPAMAVVHGLVTVGASSGDANVSRVLFGRPLLQLDDLLREAAPGDLLVSRQVVDQIGGFLQQRGVEVREHRGLLTAQTLYALELESVGALLDQAGSNETP